MRSSKMSLSPKIEENKCSIHSNNLPCPLESCGARFLASQPCNACYLLPGPDRKIVNFMTPNLDMDWTDYIFPELDQNNLASTPK